MNAAQTVHLSTQSLPWFLRSGPRLFGTLFLVLAIPLAATAYLEITQISYQLKKQAIHQNNLAAQLVARAIEEHYLGINNYVESFAARPTLIEALKKNNTRTVLSQLKELIRESRFLDRVFITDVKGILVFDYPHEVTSVGANFSSQEWFQELQKTQRTSVLNMNDASTVQKLPVATIAVPLKDINGKVFAYLVNQETSESFMMWLKKINPSFAGTIALIDDHGNLVATSETAPTGLIHLALDPFVQKAFLTRKGQIQGLDPIQKKDSLITYTTIESIEWLIFSSQPLAIVLAPLAALRPTLLGLALACFTAIFFLGLIWLRSIHRYSHELIQEHRVQEQNLIELEQAIQERKLVEEALRLSNRELEIKIRELQRLNQIMMGREKRILELKEELKAVQEKLDSETT